jgi:transcriptional regulator with GAF, ATPase, and Fis domain
MWMFASSLPRTRDLKAATTNGTFRLDLFYRLNVFPIEAPPLRERNGNIRILLEYFVKRYAGRMGKITFARLWGERGLKENGLAG